MQRRAAWRVGLVASVGLAVGAGCGSSGSGGPGGPEGDAGDGGASAEAAAADTLDASDASAASPSPESSTSDASVDAPVEASVDAPIETSVDAPVEASIDAPVEPSVDAPVEASVDATVAVDAGDDGAAAADASFADVADAFLSGDVETDGASVPDAAADGTTAEAEAPDADGTDALVEASAGSDAGPIVEAGSDATDGGACTQTFTVARVGTGAAALTASATAVFLETYCPTAGAAPLTTVALPTAAVGGNSPFSLSGSITSEGGLTRSADGHYLALAGYAVATGSTTTSAGTTRALARVDAGGNVDTSTSLAASAFTGSNVRGAASADGSAFWVSGTSSTSTMGGIWYVPFGANAGGTQISDAPNNMRWVDLFGGQLYGDSSSGTFTNVFTVGSGLPTLAGATATTLPGLPTSAASPLGFLLLSVAGGSSPDTLFIADLSAGLERWTFGGTTWTLDATFTVLSTPCLGVTGWATGTAVTLIATTQAGAIDRIDVPASGSPSVTLLQTAATNTAYRGVALAPHT